MALLLFGLVSAPTAALADDDRVTHRGGCEGLSRWLLRLTERDDPDRIAVRYTVRTPRAGHRWRVTLRRNGRTFFRGIRTTRRPSGNFTVRRAIRESDGRELVRARARNLRSGNVCAGFAVLRDDDRDDRRDDDRDDRRDD